VEGKIDRVVLHPANRSIPNNDTERPVGLKTGIMKPSVAVKDRAVRDFP
jgi:hypothetical protein